jgi:antitoxin (DNA-binding transcriptional repressor) of toxin-antitoxin stability system
LASVRRKENDPEHVNGGLDMAELLSLGEADQKLREAVERAARDGQRTILCRDGEPVAAVVGLEELRRLDRQAPAGGTGSLAEIAGGWEGFEEIEPFIEEAYRSRQRDDTPIEFYPAP